jgi:hypothetical protein
MADFSLNALDAEIARLEKKIKFGSIGQDIADEVLTIARATRSALDVMARRLEKLEDRTGVQPSGREISAHLRCTVCGTVGYAIATRLALLRAT